MFWPQTELVGGAGRKCGAFTAISSTKELACCQRGVAYCVGQTFVAWLNEMLSHQ